MRAHLVVIHDKKKNTFHFTSTSLQGEDKWFPVKGGDLFFCVESLLIGESIAHNVTALEVIRTCGACDDIKVTYNAYHPSIR